MANFVLFHKGGEVSLVSHHSKRVKQTLFSAFHSRGLPIWNVCATLICDTKIKIHLRGGRRGWEGFSLWMIEDYISAECKAVAAPLRLLCILKYFALSRQPSSNWTQIERYWQGPRTPHRTFLTVNYPHTDCGMGSCFSSIHASLRSFWYRLGWVGGLLICCCCWSTLICLTVTEPKLPHIRHLKTHRFWIIPCLEVIRDGISSAFFITSLFKHAQLRIFLSSKMLNANGSPAMNFAVSASIKISSCTSSHYGSRQ